MCSSDLSMSEQYLLQDAQFICVCVCAPHSLFGNIQEEVVKDAESVRSQQQQHLQQHSCTLDECFQLYTKEEQVTSHNTHTQDLDTSHHTHTQDLDTSHNTRTQDLDTSHNTRTQDLHTSHNTSKPELVPPHNKLFSLLPSIT